METQGQFGCNGDDLKFVFKATKSQHPHVGENEPSQQIARSFWQPQTPSCQEQQPLLLINKSLDTV